MKKPIVLSLLLGIIYLLTACSSDISGTSVVAGKTKASIASTTVDQQTTDTFSSQGVYYQFTDALGKEIILPQKPEQVVALVGSYADVWQLAGGKLVGITSDVISENRFTVDTATKVVGTVEKPNVEEILLLQPDLVLLSSELSSQVALADTLTKAGINCAYFKVESFDDYLSLLKICTDITGEADQYHQYGLAVETQIKDVIATVKAAKSTAPHVLFIRAYSGGANAKNSDSMTGRMLKDLGAINIADSQNSLLEDLSMETIISQDPDFVFVVTMGSDPAKALDGLKTSIQANPAWSQLTAVKNNRYIVLPKELFHLKPNARWGESYAQLAQILYPDLFK